MPFAVIARGIFYALWHPECNFFPFFLAHITDYPVLCSVKTTKRHQEAASRTPPLAIFMPSNLLTKKSNPLTAHVSGSGDAPEVLLSRP